MDKDNSSGITRRDLGTLAAVAIATAPKRSLAQAAPRGSPGPELDIADWSYHWFGVEHATLARGTMCNGMQMYVEHWIPREVRHPYPVVLIHGGYGQGSDWIGTPDGRRGWATLLLEQGYKVYVLDRPGQGRNPYHPWVHGYFDKEAPTFESVSKNIRGADAHTQWPGAADANDPAIAQLVASMGQPMGNNPLTQNLWRSRGAKLLDEIGPAILVTHGDGVVFASVTAQERANLVKGIVAVEQPAMSLPGQTQLAKLTGIPIAIVTAEASDANASDLGIAASLRQAGCAVEHIRLSEQNVRGNGRLVMMEKNNREALAPILHWLDTTVGKDAPDAAASGLDPNRNRETTALKLADQGLLLGGRATQADDLRHDRDGTNVCAVHDPGREALSLSGGHGARRRRPRLPHDGHRRAPGLGPLFRASRL